MITRESRLPSELRFPNRLELVRRAGVDIARTVGRFGPNAGGGRPLTVRFEEFDIIYFTAFNQPTAWLGIDWSDKTVRLQLCGLLISSKHRRCLHMFWNHQDHLVQYFRDPSDDEWDRDLRERWRVEKKRRERFELRYD